MSEPCMNRDERAAAAKRRLLQGDAVWQRISRELKRVFKDRAITLLRISGPVTRLSLQCEPSDPATVAEKLITDGEVYVEPGPSGCDPGEHYQKVVVRDATYIAHWRPDGEEVTVHISPQCTDESDFMRQVSSATTL